MAELSNRRRLEAMRLERIIRRSGCFILVEPDMRSLRVFGYHRRRVDKALELIGPPGPRRKHLVKLLVNRALPREAQS